MNDVTALMGKLKANVAYLQFDEPTEQRDPPLDLGRAAQARTLADLIDENPAAAEPEVAAPSAAPARASLLSRYVPPAAEPAPDVAPDSRLLADIFARLQRAA